MSAAAPSLNPAWKQRIPLLLLLLAWLAYWYHDTGLAMLAIWSRSDTYAHAFIVPPITLWLIWRLRDRVLATPPRSSLLLTLPVAVTTFAWLLGELTAINALSQFSLVATLVLVVMALLGGAVSRHLAFPLAFLFFSVPFGDFMMPKLMDWTAAFTVLALRASCIPVYQEGLQFVIPSGNWSVVEACSGIRYIIASVTVGTLFSYLNYTSLRRRLMFIGVSILVPVVANWLRAYMIVMLGHLSGNKLAAGVDHLIYGWVFFGMVIMIMFVIGARWTEPESEFTPPAATAGAPPGAGKTWLATVAIAVISAAGPIAFKLIDSADHAEPVQLRTLSPAGDWREAVAFTNWHPEYADPSAEQQAYYSQAVQSIGLYIAYYRKQDYTRKLVTSTNVLASSTNKIWSVTTRSQRALDITGMPAAIRQSDMLGHPEGIETRLRVWQWYWINGQLTSSDAIAKLHTAISRLSGRGDDSAVVLLFTPSGPAADQTLQAFAETHARSILTLLAATRDKR